MLNLSKAILLSLTVFGVLLPGTGTAAQTDDVRVTHEAEQTFKTIVTRHLPGLNFPSALLTR